jgi:hypothetical protein
MRDYVYPSIYFAYFFFFLALAGALYVCWRTRKHGYWGAESEVAKYRMLEDEESASPSNPPAVEAGTQR